MNVPPQPLEADLDGRIVRGLAMMQHEEGFFGLLNYRPTGGSADERALASSWLARRVSSATPETVLVSPATQTAILAFLLANTTRGDLVLAENLTFSGFRAAAACAGVRVMGLPMDGEGVIPEALNEACERHTPKAVYLIPTMQNPTTATMPPKRRTAIARVVQKFGLPLFEDDAYGLLAPDITPLAALARHHTYWAVSLSKCMAPGLRVSLLKAPDANAATRFANALRASVQMAPPLMVGLVMRWLRDGSADRIISAIRSEAAARQRIAAQALAKVDYSAHPSGHHAWLPLPARWSSISFLAAVQQRGLAVVGDDAFSIGDAPHGIRVSLGAARSRAELAIALEILAGVYGAAATSAHIV